MPVPYTAPYGVSAMNFEIYGNASRGTGLSASFNLARQGFSSPIAGPFPDSGFEGNFHNISMGTPPPGPPGPIPSENYYTRVASLIGGFGGATGNFSPVRFAGYVVDSYIKIEWSVSTLGLTSAGADEVIAELTIYTPYDNTSTMIDTCTLPYGNSYYNMVDTGLKPQNSRDYYLYVYYRLQNPGSVANTIFAFDTDIYGTYGDAQRAYNPAWDTWNFGSGAYDDWILSGNNNNTTLISRNRRSSLYFETFDV